MRTGPHFARKRDRLTQHAAHDTADESAGTGGIAATTTTVRPRASASPSATTAGAATRALLLVAGSGRRRHDLGQQGLVLQLVEVAALGIAAGGLPAVDHGASRFIALAGHLGIETETLPAAL